jgi:anti-sigma-K factor RskA
VEHVDELIPAHALRALDPDDERAVAAHLETCERCRLQLREFEGVAAALAYASPSVEPPPELRDRVLEAIEPVVAPQPAMVPPTPAHSRERWSWWPRLSLAAVPALVIAVVALALWNISLHNRLSDREVASVTPVGDIGSAVAFEGGDVTLYASLPPASPGHIYEAWVVTGGKPLPAGTFAGGKNTTFELTRGAEPGDTIAVTLEPGQGGTTPHGTAVASGELA